MTASLLLGGLDLAGASEAMGASYASDLCGESALGQRRGAGPRRGLDLLRGAGLPETVPRCPEPKSRKPSHAVASAAMTAPPWTPAAPAAPAALQELQDPAPVIPPVAQSRHKFGLFVAYAWNPEVFSLALRSYQHSGWGERLIVVDNSRQQDLAERQLVPPGIEILPTQVQLTFSQVQNFMMRTAQQRNYDFYLWGHSDVVALSSSPKVRFADEALASLDLLMEREPQWGVAFFSLRPLESDWLSAVRTRMTRELQYDTAITVYRSDCDFYPRVRAAGWRTLPVPEFAGKLFDLNRPLSLTFESWDVLKSELEAFNSTVVPENRNSWKESMFDLDEQMGMQVFQQASDHYFKIKWGTLECDEIDGGPRGDGGLRRAPWQDLIAQSKRAT